MTAATEKQLLDAMPVYRSRMSAMKAALETGGPVSLDDFFTHYDGETPLTIAAEHFGDAPTLLDLGCGNGSSVLWLAKHNDELRALAGVDLVRENIDIARSLAARLMPDDYRAAFFAHDISSLTPDLMADGCGLDEVDAMLSLHVGVHLTEAQRDSVWRFVAQVLRSGGRLFIEDFYRLRETQEDEDRLLAEQLACPFLPTLNDYVGALADVMEDATIVHEDLSFEYGVFAVQRHETYDGSDEVRREYYRAMTRLINDGALGGVRIKLERG